MRKTIVLIVGILVLGVACTSSSAPGAETMNTPVSSHGKSDVVASTSALPTPTSESSGSSLNSVGSSYSLLVGQPPPNVPGYHRGDWKHWVDEDGDCQNTRAEVLIEESLSPVLFDGCRVVSGQWLGLYTGKVETSAGALDVDHMVPLANAHRSGGWAWDASRKRAYANNLIDPDHLIAVTARANRSKGADGPEDWRPPDKGYWCEYALDWARIKEAWGLSVTQAELQALQEMVRRCAFNVELTSAGAPALPRQNLSTPTPFTVTEKVLYDPAGLDRDCGDFTRWVDAQAFYVAAGGPGLDSHRLDGDRDGVACESLRGAP